VKNSSLEHDRLASRLKHLIAELFRLDLDPETIANNQPIVGPGLGLDSLDAAELAMCLEEEFGVSIRTREDFQAFASIDSLASFIRTQVARPATSHSSTGSVLATSS
jgi:acyl carrier protein